jgi:hypothetical protein
VRSSKLSVSDADDEKGDDPLDNADANVWCRLISAAAFDDVRICGMVARTDGTVDAVDGNVHGVDGNGEGVELVAREAEDAAVDDGIVNTMVAPWSRSTLIGVDGGDIGRDRSRSDCPC